MRILFLSLIFSLAFISQVQADVAIIVNPANHNKLDEKAVRQIYLGQIKTFPNGDKVTTYDNLNDSKTYAAFVNKVLKRHENTMNAYWARMLFTAKATPPKELANTEAMLQTVANNKDAIGYVDSSKINDSVRVVATVQ